MVKSLIRLSKEDTCQTQPAPRCHQGRACLLLGVIPSRQNRPGLTPPAREGAHLKGLSRKSGTGRAEALAPREAGALCLKILYTSAESAGAFMNGFKKLLTTTFMTAAMLFTGSLQAMEIQQFDKMAVQDQGDYIQALVDGAQKVLIDQGQKDRAMKVDRQFKEVLAGDKHSLGLVEFERNLDRARVADVKRVIANPNAARIEVEDAMAVTLQKNGIELPDSFFTVAKDFKPKTSPAKEKAAKKN
jgi:hypothetical protein